MASRDLAIINRSRPAAVGVLRPAASIKAGLALSALVLGIVGAVARADNSTHEPRPPDADAQRTAPNPPPARVILPAPWEQVAPAPAAAAPVATTGRK
ncbi:MAG: hypothetical protein V7632_886 [Bradyrhizobium sp.]|jgi:hypothetical protein